MKKPSEIIKIAILSLLTALIYYFSNNTAQIIVFEAMGFAIPLAILFFGFSFFLKDFIQKKLGTQFAIWNTILVTTLVAMLYIQSALVEGNTEFTFFYVLMVSTFSAIITETIDSLVFRNILRRNINWSGRSALISNIISVPLDTAIFSFFVFYLIFEMPVSLVISLAIGQVTIKYLFSAMLTPLIAKVKAGDVWKDGTEGKSKLT